MALAPNNPFNSSVNSRFIRSCVFFLAVIWSCAGLHAQDVVRALDARAAGNQERTRFVIDLDGAVKFAAFTLADPYRVVIDVTEINFDGLTEHSREGRGLIGTFRYGLIAKGKSRMVLDLAEPARIDEAFVLEPVEDQPGRIVFDLVPTSRKLFLDSVGKLKALGTLETKLAKPAAPIRPRSNKMVIVLDAGHGGIDDGAIGPTGIKEKDLVLKFAKDVKNALEKNDAFEIYLTRMDDKFISLDDRVEFARGKGAALMVSFHADTVQESYVRGATVYTL
ncbi:MAG: N-acetylmuramoyl-L-alanine amidase, partial [Rhizobiales bacterium]|nr:N-acetylmuramoyl-L-alanine amidase [Hyphomicrobiales bacterium]